MLNKINYQKKGIELHLYYLFLLKQYTNGIKCDVNRIKIEFDDHIGCCKCFIKRNGEKKKTYIYCKNCFLPFHCECIGFVKSENNNYYICDNCNIYVYFNVFIQDNIKNKDEKRKSASVDSNLNKKPKIDNNNNSVDKVKNSSSNPELINFFIAESRKAINQKVMDEFEKMRLLLEKNNDCLYNDKILNKSYGLISEYVCSINKKDDLSEILSYLHDLKCKQYIFILLVMMMMIQLEN